MCVCVRACVHSAFLLQTKDGAAARRTTVILMHSSKSSLRRTRVPKWLMMTPCYIYYEYSTVLFVHRLTFVQCILHIGKTSQQICFPGNGTDSFHNQILCPG